VLIVEVGEAARVAAVLGREVSVLPSSLVK